MLYAPERHEPLGSAPWSADTARREIEAIVRDAEAAPTRHAWWPPHPRDDLAPDEGPQKTLYLGATGVLWAMELLAAKGAVQLTRSHEDLWQAVGDDYLSVPDTGAVVPSWFLGRAPLLLLAMLRGPSAGRAAAADALFRVVGDNIDHPTWEILWGSPGTMLAALFAHESTGETRWLDLYLRNADRLIDAWDYDEALRCHLWTQDLYGRKAALYGAGHGFAGNAFALLRGLAAFSEDRQRLVTSRVATTTKRLAVVDRGLANWPVHASPTAPMLVQWCHGAPGFLMALAGRMPKGRDEELDRLLLQAGELVWQAGPLVKGACFCHGTDGNAMALLTLFARTGDQLWLDRARAFAMHAVRQSQRSLAMVGRRRYTLWTGDLGLAVTLQACLDEQPHMPTLDFI
jgi:hypothetical protein